MSCVHLALSRSNFRLPFNSFCKCPNFHGDCFFFSLLRRRRRCSGPSPLNHIVKHLTSLIIFFQIFSIDLRYSPFMINTHKNQLKRRDTSCESRLHLFFYLTSLFIYLLVSSSSNFRPHLHYANWIAVCCVHWSRALWRVLIQLNPLL